MKFGLNAINFGPGTDPASLRGWAQFAEETGFHFLMISDHVAVTADVQEAFPAPFYDPFVSLGLFAALTNRIEIGTTVTILPYRHPLLTARMAANIDQLSGGRLILGVGAGWARQEFAALGVPFTQRGALASEYLEVIRACWANETVSYQGQFVGFDTLQTGPRPLRQPAPPIWVGGRSDAALVRAVRYGDAWHPYDVPLKQLRDNYLPKLHAIAEAEGRQVPALCPRVVISLSEVPLDERQRKVGRGSIEQVAADLKGFADLGAHYLLLDTYGGNPQQTRHPEDDWAMLMRLAEQVLDLERGSLR